VAWLRRALSGTGGGADEALQEALRLVLDDDLDGAEEALSRVVRADSDEIGVYLALARLYRRRGETGRAIRIHQNLLLRGDLDAATRDRALLGLAGDFQRGGFLQRAIAAYEEVLDRHPREREALRALVRLHADARQGDRARALLRRLARVEGRDAREEEAALWLESARAAHAEGRTEEARRDVKRALRRSAGLAEAWLELGALEAERGRTRAAIAAWRRVPDLDRGAAEAVYPRLEAAHASLGRSAEFEAWLRARIEADPDDAGARIALARALAARGEAEQALAETRAVLERDPENVRARMAVGRVLLQEGRDAEAAKALGALLDVLERGRGLDAKELFE
jgi:lipopolysaccharide biosynthesis regulator YciM